MSDNRKEIVNLLWTGGWDSTFRLIQLLHMSDECIVQPYYIIDPNRASTGAELKAMSDVKESLEKRRWGGVDRVRSTIYVDLGDIGSYHFINESYNSIRSDLFMGTQYKWIAAFCNEYEIEGIEMCILKGGRIEGILRPYLISDKRGVGGVWRVSDKYVGTREYKIFGKFTFPILDMNKKDMMQLARENGWMEIMNRTWFCHHPRKYNTPCGACNPCKYAIEGGLGYRISPLGHVRYHLRRVLPREQLKNAFPQGYTLARRAKSIVKQLVRGGKK